MKTTDDPREPTTLSIRRSVKEEAKEYGINMSRLAEQAIDAALKEHKTKRWQEENRAAMESYNEWIHKNGLPIKAPWMNDHPEFDDY